MISMSASAMCAASAAVVVGARDAVAADGDPVVGDVDPFGVEERAARAELREHAAPVRDRRRTASTARAGWSPTAPGRDAASASEPGADDDARARTWWRPRRRAAICSASEPHTAVSASVSAWQAGAAVDLALPARPLARTSTVSLVQRQPSTHEAVEVSLDRVGERQLQRCGLDRGVGGEHREHRGHRGRRASPRPWPCRRRSRRAARPRRRDRLLADGVGGEDRVAAAVATARRRPSVARRAGMPASIGVHRHRDADQAGRADEHVGRSRHPSAAAGQLAHAPRVAPTRARRWPRWRCRSLRHDRRRVPVGEMPPADLHRRRAREVGGEDAGGAAPAAVGGGDHREIGRRPTP